MHGNIICVPPIDLQIQSTCARLKGVRKTTCEAFLENTAHFRVTPGWNQ